MNKVFMRRICTMFIFIILSIEFIFIAPSVYAEGLEATDEDIRDGIEMLYNHRSAAFITGDLSTLNGDFDVSKSSGKWAIEHEIMRIKYLFDWSLARGIKFVNVSSAVRVKKVFTHSNPIKVALEETYTFDYVYSKDIEPIVNTFGVGIRHTVGLTSKNDKYMIAYDWYTDCFEDALKAYDGKAVKIDINKEPQFTFNFRLRDENYIPPSGRYNRIKAVEYADKYCGAANGEGNNLKYNKKYGDFNGIGGDCTNFASQVLGDSEGGGLKQDGKWRSANRSGSSAWVNADGLRNYLLYSGKGRLIKKGNFTELALPIASYPNGVIDQLDLGDLVCYAKGNNIDHFAIITGWDSHGYPLVNSHTTDRYHVPWDLGWGNKNINFNLIHIR